MGEPQEQCLRQACSMSWNEGAPAMDSLLCASMVEPPTQQSMSGCQKRASSSLMKSLQNQFHTCVCVFLCLHAHRHVFVCVHMYQCVCVCVSVCVCPCLVVCCDIIVCQTAFRQVQCLHHSELQY